MTRKKNMRISLSESPLLIVSGFEIDQQTHSTFVAFKTQNQTCSIPWNEACLWNKSTLVYIHVTATLKEPVIPRAFSTRPHHPWQGHMHHRSNDISWCADLPSQQTSIGGIDTIYILDTDDRRIGSCSKPRKGSVLDYHGHLDQ